MPKRPDLRARSTLLRSRHATLRPHGPDLAKVTSGLASDMMGMSQRQAIAVYMLVSLGDRPGTDSPVAAACAALLEAVERHRDEVGRVMVARERP